MAAVNVGVRGPPRERPGRTPAGAVRRVGVDALHITVCFLGEQSLGVVDEIDEIIRGAVIDLSSAGMSAGPLAVGAPVWLPPRRPRALALEIHDESGGLGALYEDLRLRLGSAIGWEPERRRLRPHITVARIRTWAPPPACVEPTPAVVFEPESITLYRSRLDPDGAVYERAGPARVRGRRRRGVAVVRLTSGRDGGGGSGGGSLRSTAAAAARNAPAYRRYVGSRGPLARPDRWGGWRGAQSRCATSRNLVEHHASIGREEISAPRRWTMPACRTRRPIRLPIARRARPIRCPSGITATSISLSVGRVPPISLPPPNAPVPATITCHMSIS